MQLDSGPQNLTFPGAISGNGAGSSQEAYATRLWEYGTRVETEATLSEGDSVTFAFALAGIDTRLCSPAKVLKFVAGRRGMPNEVDLDLSEMDDEQKAVIRAVLSNRAARRADLAAAELVKTLHAQPLRVLFKTLSPSEVKEVFVDLPLLTGDQLSFEGDYPKVAAMLAEYGSDLQVELHSRLEVKTGQFLLMDFSLPKLEAGLGLMAKVVDAKPINEHGLCLFTAHFHSILKDDADLVENALANQKSEF